jgi:hypothetical protein
VDYPTHVSRLMRAEQVRAVSLRATVQEYLDPLHRLDQVSLFDGR